MPPLTYLYIHEQNTHVMKKPEKSIRHKHLLWEIAQGGGGRARVAMSPCIEDSHPQMSARLRPGAQLGVPPFCRLLWKLSLPGACHQSTSRIKAPPHDHVYAINGLSVRSWSPFPK